MHSFEYNALMGANLKWEPTKRESHDLPYELMAVLRDKMGLDRRVSFNHSSVPYLRGLRDAGVKGAEELIDAIEKYEAVDLWLEY